MSRPFALQQLNTAIRTRADANIVNTATGYITDAELNSYINSSYAEFWELLADSYGENWALATVNITPVPSQAVYGLPGDFFKEQEVDVYVDATQTRKVTVRRYEATERNIYSSLVATAYTGLWYTNLRYRIATYSGVQSIEFIPSLGPSPQVVRLTYTQCAPTLVTVAPTLYATATNYNSGALVYVTGLTVNGFTVNQVFSAANSGTSGGSAPSWSTTATTTDNTITWYYVGQASTVITTADFINGWEEYVITDGIIKVKLKNESDAQGEMAAKAALTRRIVEAAKNRDYGEPKYITDVYGSGPEGLGPWGGGWSPY